MTAQHRITASTLEVGTCSALSRLLTDVSDVVFFFSQVVVRASHFLSMSETSFAV